MPRGIHGDSYQLRLIFDWAREVKAGGTATPVPGAAVPAWGVASMAAAVLGSHHLLVSYRKMISVHLSEHELHFDTKNTDQALLSYVEFVAGRRKELNAEAGSPPALPPRHPDNLLRLQISDAGFSLWQSGIRSFFWGVAAGYLQDVAPGGGAALTPAVVQTAANIRALADMYGLPW